MKQPAQARIGRLSLSVLRRRMFVGLALGGLWASVNAGLGHAQTVALPPVVNGSIGIAQLASTESVPEPRTFLWAASEPSPGVFSSLYTPYDRDPDRKRSVDWYEQNYPEGIAYQCDGRTKADSSGYRSKRFAPVNVFDPVVASNVLAPVLAKAAGRGYQSISFDNITLNNVTGRCGTWTPAGFQRSFSGDATDQKFAEAVLLWMKGTRSMLHERGLAMASNVSYNPRRPDYFEAAAAHTDIIMHERGFARDGKPMVLNEAWIAQFETLSRIAARQPIVIVNYVATPFSNASTELLEWVLGNYLLVRGERTYLVASGRGEAAVYQDDAKIQVDIGQPKDLASRHGDLFLREYEAGLVVVNPFSEVSREFTLPSGRTYLTREGQRRAGSIVISPGSAMVLKLEK